MMSNIRELLIIPEEEEEEEEESIKLQLH